MAVADGNSDGRPDLVVANVYSDTIGVLLGNGDGTFRRAVAYSSGGHGILSMVVKDVNGDGSFESGGSESLPLRQSLQSHAGSPSEIPPLIRQL